MRTISETRIPLSETGRRIWIGLVILSFLSLLLPVLAQAEPSLSVYAGWHESGRQHVYCDGETIDVYVNLENTGEPTVADAYIGLLTSDGVLCTLGERGWSSGFEPFVRQMTIPTGFVVESKALCSIEIPSEMPPIGEPGEYYVLAGLTTPGTPDLMGGLSISGFLLLSDEERWRNIEQVALEVAAMALRSRRWYQTPTDEGGGGGCFHTLTINDIGSSSNERGDGFAISGLTHDSFTITGSCSLANKADGSAVTVVAIVSMDEERIVSSIYE